MKINNRAALCCLIFVVGVFAVISSVSDASAQYIRQYPQAEQQSQNAPKQQRRNNQSTQDTQKSDSLPSQGAVEYAKMAAQNCLGGRWEEQACLRAVSQNTLVMASNYMADLQERKKAAASETIKQNCAAATAATKGEYPAYAMRSAFVECANIVYDVRESSGVTPDLSQYQLLVGAVQCLDKSNACKAFEQGMQRYK